MSDGTWHGWQTWLKVADMMACFRFNGLKILANSMRRICERRDIFFFYGVWMLDGCGVFSKEQCWAFAKTGCDQSQRRSDKWATLVNDLLMGMEKKGRVWKPAVLSGRKTLSIRFSSRTRTQQNQKLDESSEKLICVWNSLIREHYCNNRKFTSKSKFFIFDRNNIEWSFYY